MTDIQVFDSRGQLLRTEPLDPAAAQAIIAGSPLSIAREAPASAPAGQRRWYIVEAWASQETTATKQLLGRGFAIYSPVLTVLRKAGRVVQERLRPMFPGYVFVNLDLRCDPWERIFALPGVRGMMRSGDALAEVKASEMAIIRAVEGETEARRKEAERLAEARTRFTIGQMVKIAEGSFAEQMGLIDRLDDGERIVVLLSLFGRKTRVITSARQLTDVVV